jgi:hypothetical protein
VPAGGLFKASRSSSRQCVLQAMSTERAARRCVERRMTPAWRGAGAPRVSGGVRNFTGGGGVCGEAHRLVTAASDVYMCKTHCSCMILTTQDPSRGGQPLITSKTVLPAPHALTTVNVLGHPSRPFLPILWGRPGHRVGVLQLYF